MGAEVISLRAAQWWDLKVALKTGVTRLEDALSSPASIGRPVVTVLALASLSRNQDHHNATRSAHATLTAAAIAPTTFVEDLTPAGRAALVLAAHDATR